MRKHFGDTRDLFLGFRVALDPRKMILGLCGLCFGFAGLTALALLGAQAGLSGSELELLWLRLGQGELFDSAVLTSRGVQRVFCGGSPQELFPGTACVLGLAAFVWWTLVWSLFGGAIARIAAVEVARDERITANEALHFARERFSTFFWGPMGLVVMLGVLLGVNVLIGVIGKIPWAGDLWIALTYPVVLLLSMIALLGIVGAALSFPLFAPALAAEATDSFDGVSRSFSYLYSRPWAYLWYFLVAKVYGAIGFAVVALFGWALVALSLGSLGTGLDAGRNASRQMDRVWEYLSGPLRSGGPITMDDFMTEFGATSSVMLLSLTFCVLLVAGLVAGFGVSLHYSLRTCVYFLLRHKVDATEMDEVWMPEAEREEPVAPAPAVAADPADPAAPVEAAEAEIAPPTPAEPPPAPPPAAAGGDDTPASA